MSKALDAIVKDMEKKDKQIKKLKADLKREKLRADRFQKVSEELRAENSEAARKYLVEQAELKADRLQVELNNANRKLRQIKKAVEDI